MSRFTYFAVGLAALFASAANAVTVISVEAPGVQSTTVALTKSGSRRFRARRGTA